MHPTPHTPADDYRRRARRAQTRASQHRSLARRTTDGAIRCTHIEAAKRYDGYASMWLDVAQTTTDTTTP